MNVLLVDDEIPSLDELNDAVKDNLASSNIYSFSKAKEAMNFVLDTKIDIAFLDINMRFMNGITMAKKINELYPTCNIIFCTGHSEFALEAFDTYCSNYLLKPISKEKVKSSLKHLRYPIEEVKKRFEIKCFGNFDVFCDEKPIAFKYKKTRELLAYLVDRNGAEVTTQEIMAAIFEETKQSYFSNIRLDLLNTFKELNISNVIYSAYGRMRIIRENVKCDYFDYLDGKNVKFYGEYMTQYSFAEETKASLFWRLKH